MEDGMEAGDRQDTNGTLNRVRAAVCIPLRFVAVRLEVIGLI